MPSRTYFRETVIPSLHEEVKKEVSLGISKAVSVALTTDGWTSRATESYITTAAHYISQEWKLEALGKALNDMATRWNTIREHGMN